ncbi:helix-turn-helix domain-containing protein [Ruminococcus sp.]|uniref:helix-turn-helix domain-containing protein n=1 Tax=Ruminococcus sp. TaxID=41978 RepID=UPI0025D6DDFE|nr:helix-turn-helix domain-containing protein [Ruminococcus sp.]MCI5816020.1 helix-turn-helix domain-containing protein [Ruminococcus sp.]MDD7555497.1 helix-turn-helix domain-containing protein [Ruminococcus sp.]
MKNFEVLTEALAYIEQNLEEEFTQQDVANACYVSLSGLQKLFRYAVHFSVGEYISKRRLTHAARLLCSTERSVTEIALQFQYHSPEVFARAFSRLWGVNPSVFRSSRRFTDLYPRLLLNQTGGTDMPNQRFDISELYDFLGSRRDCYIICFDTVRLMETNDTYGREAGDLLIRTSLERIEQEQGENMLLVRVGGDEYALVTDIRQPQEAEQLMQRVLAHNGEPVHFRQGLSLPLSLRGGLTRFEGTNMKYSELFDQIEDTINCSRG